MTDTAPGDEGTPERLWDRLKQHPLAKLGPGLITGVADDDPSGIATYSQAGAQFGLDMLWTMPLTYPLMCAVQQMCANLGRVTGRGLAANIKAAFPPVVLRGVVLLLLIANTLNIAADVAAMGEVAELVSGIDRHLMTAAFVFGTLALQLFIPYHRYVFFLKWLTLSLLAYAAVLFTVQVPWAQVALHTAWPRFRPDASAAAVVVGLFGTTISPYLFFWQASEEVEDMPVLAGSGAYALAEAMGWNEGLEREVRDARGFYAIIAVSVLAGLGIQYSPISPMKALFWSAVINGVVAVPLLVVIVILVSKESIMGAFTASRPLVVLGWITAILMGAASVAMFIPGGS